MDMEFNFEVVKDSTVDTVRFCGIIDSHTELKFAELCDEISGSKVVMDFSKTVRINSMGIAILLRSIKSIMTEKKSEVAIIGENKTNSLLFEITGIYKLVAQKTHVSC